MIRPDVMGCLLGIAAAAASCAPGSESSGPVPPAYRASYPLYVTLPGKSANSGRLLRITPYQGDYRIKTIATGLASPTGITSSPDGDVYVATRPAQGAGAVLHFPNGTTPPSSFRESVPPLLDLTAGRTQLFATAASGEKTYRLPLANQKTNEDKPSLSGASGISVGADGNRYVASSNEGAISVVTDDAVSNTFGTFENPVDVWIGPDGFLYVVDKRTGQADGGIFRLSDKQDSEQIVTGLVNPIAVAVTIEGHIWAAEAAPTTRLILKRPGTSAKRVVATFDSPPAQLTLTPRAP